MIGILKANPGRIHSLHEFVVAAHAAFPTLMHLPATPFCIVPLALSTMEPTCRRDTVGETQPYARCGRRAIAVRRKSPSVPGPCAIPNVPPDLLGMVQSAGESVLRNSRMMERHLERDAKMHRRQQFILCVVETSVA